jgi:glycosyltransferase involved in cell wall biosynthesis
MKVSIALTTYNGAKHLREQLDSYAAQSRPPHELVVCDDGSRDDTVEILQSFKETAPFEVLILQNPVNLGFTKNFEKALSLTTGDLVFMSDQDDVWFPEKIAVVEAAVLACPGTLIAVHDGLLVDSTLKSRGATKLGQILRGYGSSEHLVAGTLSAVRRELLDLALPFPTGIVGHDVWLHRLGSSLGARLVVDRPLEVIRRHSSNTSEWVASSVEPINRLDVLLSQARTSIADSYADRILINEALQSRLRLARESGFGVPLAAIEAGLSQLEVERRVLVYRDALPNSSWLKRKRMAMKLLLAGEYRYFSGAGSFLRDIIR